MKKDQVGYSLELTWPKGQIELIAFNVSRKEIVRERDVNIQSWKETSEGFLGYAPVKRRIVRLKYSVWARKTLPATTAGIFEK